MVFDVGFYRMIFFVLVVVLPFSSCSFAQEKSLDDRSIDFSYRYMQNHYSMNIKGLEEITSNKCPSTQYDLMRATKNEILDNFLKNNIDIEDQRSKNFDEVFCSIKKRKNLFRTVNCSGDLILYKNDGGVAAKVQVNMNIDIKEVKGHLVFFPKACK